MTPLDFFLWGFVKDKVYRTPVTDIAELRGQIYEAIGLVTPEMLSRAWQEIEYRLDIARATNGAHIEGCALSVVHLARKSGFTALHRIGGRKPSSLHMKMRSMDFGWRNVIFSDEVIVSNSNDRTVLVYCMNGHRYDERFVRRIINKSGCVRVACWGWMSYDGAELLKRIHGRFTAEVYENILANVMILSSRKRYPEGTLFYRQDNHPIHTTNRIQRWFTRRRDVDPVDWPPNSPDMNPFQNFWAAVKRILRSNWAEQPPVRTSEELWDRVLDAWEDLAKNLDLFHNVVDSMPRRMRAVVDAGCFVYEILGCETWTLTLRGEQRLRVFENKVLRKIFGAKRDEVTGEWKKLHNAELHALFSSPDIIRNIKSKRLRWAVHVVHVWANPEMHIELQQDRWTYATTVWDVRTGKRRRGRPKCRRADVFQTAAGADWTRIARDRVQRKTLGREIASCSAVAIWCDEEEEEEEEEEEDDDDDDDDDDDETTMMTMTKDGDQRSVHRSKPKTGERNGGGGGGDDDDDDDDDGKCNYDGEMRPRSNVKSYPATLLQLVEEKPRKKPQPGTPEAPKDTKQFRSSRIATSLWAFFNLTMFMKDVVLSGRTIGNLSFRRSHRLQTALIWGKVKTIVSDDNVSLQTNMFSNESAPKPRAQKRKSDELMKGRC
ncbi:hypothetical protein ANN_06696 [Periplaneta americana]|uniref:Tc1-like transposase DDE domain-containing protein n=1 Tax=Periplaneta americana TaxID=6978 RepID=A0ABQ8TE67_PERAM|nr:hypothetical protein ANN_06696 [Periplaneta americana]